MLALLRIAHIFAVYTAGGLIASGGADSSIKLWPLSEWASAPVRPPAPGPGGAPAPRATPGVQQWQLDPPQRLLRSTTQAAAGLAAGPPHVAGSSEMVEKVVGMSETLRRPPPSISGVSETLLILSSDLGDL